MPIPPDFTTFWRQAQQQGYQPRIATIGKALLFPSSVEALGEIGDNLGTEVWWHPTAPFASSLTDQSSQELADAYEEETGGQWTQPLGFSHALFEVAVAAVEEAGSTEPEAVTEALSSLQVSTVVGDLAWGADENVPPYVAKTPVTGGQWRTDDGESFELVVVSNTLQPEIPTGAPSSRWAERVAVSTPVLRVEHLAKAYGRVVTARDVSFDVAAGEVLGVVGPNGAGKSTLLSLVTGTTPADGGRVRLDGVDVTRASAARRSALGVVAATRCHGRSGR